MRWLVVLGLVFAFGAARLPLEVSLDRQHQAALFRTAKLDISLREKIGQANFIAALSGFRAPIADILWIQAYSAWERTEYGKMALIFDNVTSLEPRNSFFWENAGWHMAWNGSVFAFENPKQPRLAIRKKEQEEYFALGEDFLVRGIRNNPESYQLRQTYALFLEQKRHDECGAAEQYRLGAQLKNTLPYMERAAAIHLAKCPGSERLAYEKLRSLWLRSADERKPTLIRLVHSLEVQLQIPNEQRIYKSTP